MELATGAMGSLLLKLADLLKEEYKLHKDLRKEVESLSLDLESLHGALHKVAQVPRDQLDEQVWIWAREVRKASYAMEDIVDSFLVRVDDGHDHEAEAKKTGLKRFKEKTRNLFNLKKLADRRSIAGKIQDIKNQLQAIALRRSMYRVDDIVAKPAATTLTMDDPRLLDLQRVTKLFGIEEPREALIRMLSEGEDSHGVHQEMKIVSIVGYGGLGKTTLAKAVYDKLKVKFQCVAFVPVGQYPDMKKIFLDILIDLDKEKYTNANMTILDQYQLISEIKGFLQDKRYFIVIDDIWDTPTWELIKCALVDNYLRNVVVMEMPQVRSVTAFGGLMDALPPLSSFPVLRVLTAAWNSVLKESHYLEGLGSSLHLRYINLMHTRTRQLPKDIGHLKLLQVLEIYGTGIEELPESMALLQGLICLRADWKTRMPDWLGKLTSLQELWIWPAVDKYARFVEELRKLRELRVLVTCNAPPYESVQTDLLEALRSLHKIMVIDLGSKFESQRLRKACKEGFVLSLHLRRLILGGIKFPRLPVWISPLRLPNLCDLLVYVHDVEQQDMDVIGDFKYLRNLHILIVSNKTGEKEILTCGIGAFQNVRLCHIYRQVMFVHGSMPRLEDVRLEIRVWEVKGVSPDFDFDLGLLNLPAIQQVMVNIDCAYSRAVDVEEAEAALRHAVHMHPNSPTLTISRSREEISYYSRNWLSSLYGFVLPSLLQFMLLMLEEYKELGARFVSLLIRYSTFLQKNEVLGQVLIQHHRFEEIREEFQEAKEMQGALPINSPNLLETRPLMEHLTKDVLGPDAMKILSDDWMSLCGMLASDKHGLDRRDVWPHGSATRLKFSFGTVSVELQQLLLGTVTVSVTTEAREHLTVEATGEYMEDL
ncbi:putative disease resistance RPP8-like protein 2 [Hordeum vulgare]|nr:putative disease resistance RPP8-like protein 2 [Hordeum vulgare]